MGLRRFLASAAPRDTFWPAGARWAVCAYLGLLVVLPLAEILRTGLAGGPRTWMQSVVTGEAREAILLSLWTSALAALVNAIAGTATAWILVRRPFVLRPALSALVDLPLAIPTLLTGLMLVSLYGPTSFVGARLEALGLRVAFAPPGIVLALLFVTFPLVVRTVEPVLRELDLAEEEAARMLGASRFATFRRVILPALLPAIASGAAQTFARALAEFGSLIVVSGNVPGHTLTAPVYIFGEVEANHPANAAVASIVLLAIAMLSSLAVRGATLRMGAHREA